MKILKTAVKNYKEDPCRFFDFERFEDESGDFLLSNGVYDFESIKNQKENSLVHIELEEPNRFLNNFTNFDKYENYFKKILTICPYSAEWQNNKNKNNKRIAVFFPFNENHIPEYSEKKYDIIYTGHIVSKAIERDVEKISKFNYRLVSGSDHKLVTNTDASYKEKLKLIAESKITLSHGLLFLNRKHAINIFKKSDYRKNTAFKNITKINLIKLLFNKNHLLTAPQIKSRVFEAAFCKSLILHKRDDFNVIENFFEAEKEFIYYNDENLEQKIKDILQNYDKYKIIIENAYNRAITNYTTTQFYKKYLKKIAN